MTNETFSLNESIIIDSYNFQISSVKFSDIVGHYCNQWNNILINSIDFFMIFIIIAFVSKMISKYWDYNFYSDIYNKKGWNIFIDISIFDFISKVALSTILYRLIYIYMIVKGWV